MKKILLFLLALTFISCSEQRPGLEEISSVTKGMKYLEDVDLSEVKYEKVRDTEEKVCYTLSGKIKGVASVDMKMHDSSRLWGIIRVSKATNYQELPNVVSREEAQAQGRKIASLYKTEFKKGDTVISEMSETDFCARKGGGGKLKFERTFL